MNPTQLDRLNMANAPEKNPAEAQRDLAAAMSMLASRPAPTGKRPLTGRERAAVLMLALGEQYSAKIWGMLDDDELRELSVAMSGIGAIEADVVENLLLEFVTRMSASGALMGSYEATERLAATVSAARAGRRDHGPDPRSRRPQHVGESPTFPG
jgi:flagellar motor switch protein FliG